MDEQENSSAGGNHLPRTDSQMSQDKPLSEEEYMELERRLAQEGHTTSMLGQFQSSSNASTQQPSMIWTGEGGSVELPMVHTDTLEANPIMVNPMEIQNQHQINNHMEIPQLTGVSNPLDVQEAVAGNSGNQVAAPIEASQISTQPDGTFTIPLITTPSGTNFFRTQSGSQYTIIENPPTPGVTTAIKQELAGAFTPVSNQQQQQQLMPQQPQQQGQNGLSIEDAWSSMVEDNNEFNLRGGMHTPALPTAPTGDNPVFKPIPGRYDFTVAFQKLTENAKNKSWDFSSKLKKLYIDANKEVMACFTIKNMVSEGFFIRLLPVYAESQSFKSPVTRCPNHASLDHLWNKDFNLEYRHHLIRAVNKSTVYEEDQVSKRLSCKFPVEIHQYGADQMTVPIKFMCLGSDVGGINRRALMVIFTLETSSGEVVGRARVDVRICSCPRRDKKTDEDKKNEDDAKAREVARGVGEACRGVQRNGSFIMNTTPPTTAQPTTGGKKRKIDPGVDDMVMVPVARRDFEHINYLSEAAMIANNPAKASEIKLARRNLLESHNPNTFKRVKKETKPKTDK